MAQRPNDPDRLTSFWIEGTDKHGSVGFGVTAWSIQDALDLLREQDFKIDHERAVVRENVYPHEVEFGFVQRIAGPAYFRGVWYPPLNIGWRASGQR
jgi:hypothetical protein